MGIRVEPIKPYISYSFRLQDLDTQMDKNINKIHKLWSGVRRTRGISNTGGHSSAALKVGIGRCYNVSCCPVMPNGF